MGFYTDKVVIITGAASGIGKALGEKLAEQGAIVILTDINGEKMVEIAEGLHRDGCQAEGFQLDVSDAAAVKKIVDDTVAKHNRLDCIFNNAGIAVGGEVRDCTVADWREVLDVNLYGVIHGIDAAYPVMVKQGFGHIINTGSIEGLIPFPNTVSYVASKHAVVGLSTALRIEGADLGVKVSVVCPGYIKTRIFEDSRMINLDWNVVKEKLEKMKGTTPEVCADVILQGVERNKAIIPVTRAARILWWLHRLRPGLVIWLMGRGMRASREEARIVA